LADKLRAGRFLLRHLFERDDKKHAKLRDAGSDQLSL
jgi:hypothetical protein